MGSNCTSCKMTSPHYKNKRTKTNDNYKNKSLTNYENKPSLIDILKNYIFFKITKSKNDYYIECDLHLINTEELENIIRYFEKWTKIISLSRTERKASYQNLVSEKEKNEKKFIDLNNILSTSNNFEIKIYNGRDKFFSDLIIKLQIAYMYNKDRYIKYLSKGPPNNIRWAIWLTLAITDPNSKFLSQAEYLELTLKNDADFEASYDEQIKKDIKRSNIGLDFLFEKVAEDCLYRILKALSLMDPELGYCQGMNIITANLLMISDCNELETFNLMLYLLKNLELREFFLNGFPKLLMFIFIFNEFIKDQYPLIHDKLEFLDIPEELWIFKWLQTLFFMSLPLAISVRIIDCILCFGLEFLLNFSLSWIKVNESKIISCDTMEQFIEIFKGPEILEDEVEQYDTEDKTYEKYVTSEDTNINKQNKKAEGNLDEFKKFEEYKKDLNFTENQLKDIENNDIYDKNFLRKASKFINYSKKNAYLKIFDFTNDIIFFRENLVRDAKCLCIRDLIDKMIEKYSYNHHPLLNFNPNNVILNNNENYDEFNNINPNNDKENENSKNESKLSRVSSPKSVYSNSITSRSNFNEFRKIDKENEEEEKDNDFSEKKEKINLNNLDEEDNNSKKSGYRNEDEINDEISCINSKNHNNIKGDFGKQDSCYKKSITFKTNNILDDIQTMSNLKQDFCPVLNRKSNFIFPKNSLNLHVERNKSVKFEIFNGENIQNTISSNKITGNERDFFTKRKTLDEFLDNSLKSKNLTYNVDEMGVVSGNFENTHYNTQRYEETNELHKISGKTHFTSIENLNTKEKPIRNVRQSLNLNFRKRLNIDQILMINKIKSKISIIQTLNENKQSKISSLRDINNDENANFNKFQEKILVKNQEEIKQFNNKDKNFEQKRTICDIISSTTERKNTLNTEHNQNQNIENSQMDILNKDLSQRGDLNENDQLNSNNQLLNINNNSTLKRRNTSLPFLNKSPLDKIQNSEFDENILKSKKKPENQIGNFSSKNINNSEREKIDIINKNINYKNKNLNINIYDKNNKCFKGLHYNINNIIIEEDPGIVNGEDN